MTMYQEKSLTDEEQRDLYNACSKDDLIEMVIACNKLIDSITKTSPPHFSSTVDKYFWELS